MSANPRENALTLRCKLKFPMFAVRTFHRLHWNPRPDGGDHGQNVKKGERREEFDGPIKLSFACVCWVGAVAIGGTRGRPDRRRRAELQRWQGKDRCLD